MSYHDVHVHYASTEAACESLPCAKTTAINRSWSHVDAQHLMSCFGFMSCLYTVVAMPITVATTQQQCLRDSPSVSTVMRRVWKDQGLKGLYRGFGCSLVGGVVSDVALFGTLEFFKEKLPVQTKESRDFCAGTLADFIATPIWVPFNVIITRQVSAGHGMSEAIPYENSLQTAKRLVAQSGWTGLWKGTMLSLLSVPVTGLWWSLYGVLKHAFYEKAESLRPPMLDKETWSSEDNVPINMMVGSVTSCTITFISNPLWVVRTRLQVMDLPATVKWRMAHIVKDIYRQEGFRGFLKGLGGGLIVSAATGVGFGAFYEGAKLSADTTRN